MNKILILAFFLGTFSPIFAQNGYKIEANLKEVKEGQMCYLAYYYGYNQYIKQDSAKATKGKISFEGKEKLKEGLYLLVLNPAKYYELIIGEQRFSFQADTSKFVETAQFKGSKDNQLFYDFQREMRIKSKAFETLSKAHAPKAEIDAQYDAIDALRTSLVQKNKGTLVAKFIQATLDPQLPKEIPTLANGKKDSTFAFYYFKNHFLDAIDFADERLIRSPFLQQRVERYMKELTYQYKDSVIKSADLLLNKAQANKDVFRYCLSLIANQYETTKIVGLDGVFVYLADNYYLNGKASWLDSTQKVRFQERADVLRRVESGKVFPACIGTDLTGKEINVLDIAAKYTVVVFYSDDCGHCKDAAPKLADFQERNKAKGIQVFNVDTHYDENKWRKFVDEYKLQNVVNVWDKPLRYRFLQDFDVQTTPTTYILDRNKRIIAKKIPVEEFERFLEFYEKVNGK